MSKFKVLHMPIYAVGGINQYVLKNWEFIAKSKFQFDFATLSKTPLDLERELKKQGCKVHYISCYAEENERQFVIELNRIFDEGYNAVHLHTSFWRGFLMEEVAKLRKVPVIIIHAHSTMADISDVRKREAAIKSHERLKSMFNEDMATHFCACSSAAADWLFGGHIPREKIRILNNAIDTKEFSYSPLLRCKLRKELGLEDSFVIGHAGRFSYQKNHDMLISVFNNVSRLVPRARLLLAGDGELRVHIEKKTADYGISDKVLFLGHRYDIPALMQAMDVFALPSRFEGLGLVLIEAQNSGLKCLAGEFVPRESKITHNLEFLPYDDDAWVKKIVEMADNDYIRIDMSEETAKSGYSAKEQVEILEQIYSNEL